MTMTTKDKCYSLGAGVMFLGLATATVTVPGFILIYPIAGIATAIIATKKSKRHLKGKFLPSKDWDYSNQITGG